MVRFESVHVANAHAVYHHLAESLANFGCLCEDGARLMVAELDSGLLQLRGQVSSSIRQELLDICYWDKTRKWSVGRLGMFLGAVLDGNIRHLKLRILPTEQGPECAKFSLFSALMAKLGKVSKKWQDADSSLAARWETLSTWTDWQI